VGSAAKRQEKKRKLQPNKGSSPPDVRAGLRNHGRVTERPWKSGAGQRGQPPPRTGHQRAAAARPPGAEVWTPGAGKQIKLPTHAAGTGSGADSKRARPPAVLL
jgi:uncharacterized protein involved in type VI secretion and phage assembly